MNEAGHRTKIRRAYDFRCGYCGVHESEAGTELEIDHFMPRSLGGSDDLDNLVYCCTACNRLKSDFWPQGDPSLTPHRLLHPHADDLTLHLNFGQDGFVTDLSETGAFHISRLRLNRAPLLAQRRHRVEFEMLRNETSQLREEQVQLRTRLQQLEDDLQAVLAQISQILRS